MGIIFSFDPIEFNSSTEYEKESPYFYYYLGFLVLEAHICMLTKSYDRALKIYNKLLKGTNNCKKDQKVQQLIRIIPHTLLIKYNMGECYRNIGKSNETDELFFDVVRNFNFYDQELLE